MSNRKSKKGFKAGISIFLVMVLLISSISMTSASNNQSNENESELLTKTVTYTFSEPQVIIKDDTNIASLSIQDISDKCVRTNYPILPKKSGYIELPLETHIESVTFEKSNEMNLDISGDFNIEKGADVVVRNKIVTNVLGNSFLDKIGNSLIKFLLLRNVKSDNKYLETVDYNIKYKEDFGNEFSYWTGVGRNENFDLVNKVHYSIIPCDGINYFTDCEITIEYSISSTQRSRNEESYDLVILSPSAYLNDLQPLVEHKEDHGLKTKLVCLNEIYDETYFDLSDTYNRDNQEKIKWFIYKSIIEWDVDFVMIVGGYRATMLGLNIPSMQFPVRYSNLVDVGDDEDLLYPTDQYYSCCIKNDMEFDDWDSNENDRFAEWCFTGYDTYDPDPDVAFGRLACRSNKEVKDVVAKIIKYENEVYGQTWLNNMLAVSGDGFQDAGYVTPNNVEWNINSLEDGEYTIYVQSKNLNNLKGPIDMVEISINHDSESLVTFEEDDHLNIEKLDPLQDTKYPAKPVADIIVPSNSNILGNTDVVERPNAYLSDTGWADVEYEDGIIQIRVKSYDPNLQGTWNFNDIDDLGSHTTFDVWVKNETGDIVFESDDHLSSVWYEGELECFQALKYRPDLQRTIKTTSNGGWESSEDIINNFNDKKYGYMHYAGHSSPFSWVDHFPGIPGGRYNGGVSGISTLNLDFDWKGDDVGDSFFQFDELQNGDVLPVMTFSGCNSGKFDSSFSRLFTEPEKVLGGHGFGGFTPESMGWWFVKLPNGGAITCIANSGLGPSYLGASSLYSLIGYSYPLFFEYATLGKNVGIAFAETLSNYAGYESPITESGPRTVFEIMNLFGDPSLKIGGYSDEEMRSTQTSYKNIVVESKSVSISQVDKMTKVTNEDVNQLSFENNVDRNNDDFVISDKYTPGYISLISVDDGHVAAFSHEFGAGIAFSSNAGIVWDDKVFPSPCGGGSGYSYLYSWEDDENNEHSIFKTYAGSREDYDYYLEDPMNIATWEASGGAFSIGIYVGEYGLSTAGIIKNDIIYPCSICTYDIISQKGIGCSYNDGFLFLNAEYNELDGSPSLFNTFSADADHSTDLYYYSLQKYGDSNTNAYSCAIVADMTIEDNEDFNLISLDNAINPHIAAEDGNAYFVVEDKDSEMVLCYKSTNGGNSWVSYEVSSQSHKPKIYIRDDRVECYYLQDNKLMCSISYDEGETWTEIVEVYNDFGIENDEYYEIGDDIVIYTNTTEGKVYSRIDPQIQIIDAKINDIVLSNDKKTISTSFINSGTIYSDFDWEIIIEGYTPFEKILGENIITSILTSFIINDGFNNGNDILSLSEESYQISSEPVFGFGHICVKVTVTHGDNTDPLDEKIETGFLIGGRMFLYEED